MYSRYLPLSDLPYRAYSATATGCPLQDNNTLPQTEAGKHVLQVAEQLRAGATVAFIDIPLISLAAAFHPDVLCGRALVWIDGCGEPVMAFDPATPLLWHEDPRRLFYSGQPMAAIRFDGDRYNAMVEGEFLYVEGEDAFYKALLMAVHQYGAGMVTTPSGERLRLTLAAVMQAHADTLGRRWQGTVRGIPTWETHDGIKTNHSAALPALAEQTYAALASRGQLAFIPSMTNKIRVVEGIVGLMAPVFSTIGRSVVLNRQTFPPHSTNSRYIHSGIADERGARNEVVVPLMTASTAAVAVSHPARSHVVRTAVSMCGVTSFLWVGKRLVSLFTQGTEQKNTPDTHRAAALSMEGNALPDITFVHSDNMTLCFSHPGQDDNYRAFSISDDTEIAYRLTQHAPAEMLAPARKGEVTTALNEPDDVRVERIDLSCVEARQTLSFADIVRKIGKTLSYPISELAKETQVIFFYERFRRCPTDQDIKSVEAITVGIDTFMSYFISLLPDGSVYMLLQNIGGPLFQLLADAIENKELDIDNINAVNDQVLFLARSAWDFLPRERNGEINKEKIELPQKTYFKDNALSTSINNDAYRLHYENGGYVGKNQHAIRDLTYSYEEGTWIFSEKNAYFYEIKYHENMVDTYKVANSYIQSIRKYTENNKGLSLDKKNHILYVLKRDDDYAKFVFMESGGRKFNIESDFYKINSIHHAYAKKEGLENKLIRLNNNQFYFEARTTKISDDLINELNAYGKPYTLSDKYRFSTIMDDGFSYDLLNRRYLKCNGNYYRVDKDEFEQDCLSCLRADKHERIYIKKNKSGFFDIDVGFPDANLASGFIPINEGFFIENDIALEIEKNCVPYDGEKGDKVDGGVFKGANDQHVFALKDVCYQVVEHKKDIVIIKSKYDGVDDIHLYATNNCYFEFNRNRRQNEREYIDITSPLCKVKRTPMAPPCKSTVISKTADNLLRAKAKQGAVSLDLREEKLRLSALFPSLFVDSENHKSYFKYDGLFYRAEFSASTSNSVLKQPALHVYYKGLFGGKNTVANLVYDVVNHKTIIQTQEEALYDNTYLTNREAIDFIRSHDFLTITDFANLKDVVSAVNNKAKLKFVVPTEIVNVNVDVRHEAKTSFSYDNDEFRIISAHEDLDSEPLYIRGGALAVKNSIKYAKKQIDVAVHELDDFTPNAQKYLGYVLGDEYSEIIKDFSIKLSFNLKVIKEKINKHNVKLVAKDRVPITEGFFEQDVVRDADTLLHAPDNEPYFHFAALSEEQRRAGAVAFVPLDKNKNIFICLDKLYFIDPIHPDETLRQDHCLDITETLIHEGSHSMGLSHDIFYISTEDGKLTPVLDAIDEYGIGILTGRLDDNEELMTIQQDYMRLHPEYSAFTGRVSNNNRILRYMFHHDAGFKANVLLSTPDFYAIFARDLYLNSAVVLSRR